MAEPICYCGHEERLHRRHPGKRVLCRGAASTGRGHCGCLHFQRIVDLTYPFADELKLAPGVGYQFPLPNEDGTAKGARVSDVVVSLAPELGLTFQWELVGSTLYLRLLPLRQGEE